MKKTFKYTIQVSKLIFASVVCAFGIGSVQAQDEWGYTPKEHYVNLDSLRPYTYEYIPEVSEEEVIPRLGAIENRIKLNYNRKVLSFIDFFVVRNRAYSKMVLARKDMYFPIFEAALERHGLPKELKYLAIVESGLKNTAKSGVGAMGLWQFMGPTGRMYHLNYDANIDDRMDPYKSTEAACLYLKWLFKYFGDWELALSAYNCGPGYVKNAIKKAGGVNSFWAIYNYLPQETRSYVPQFVAIAYMVNYAHEHNLYPDYKEYIWENEVVTISDKISVKTFCNEAGLCYDDIKKLNPSLKSGIVHGHERTYQLRIPKDQHDKIKDNLHNIIASSKLATFEPQAIVKTTNDSLKSDSSAVNSVANNDAEDKNKVETKKVKLFHTTSKGQKVSQIARIYGMSVRELCKLNGIKENAKLKKGKRLIVVREVNVNPNNTAIVKTKTKIKAPKVHYVQAGDTLWTISKKYGGLPIARLKKMNKLKGTNLKLGQKIIIG